MDLSPTYRERRKKLMARHDRGLVLVRGGSPGGLNPSFFYLTGIAEPRGVLLLAPQGARVRTGARYPGPDYVRGQVVRQILFLPSSDELAAKWGEDSAATWDRVPAGEAGVDAVLAIEALESLLDRELASTPVLHYVRAAPPTLAGAEDPDTAFVSRVRRRFFGVRVEDATCTVHALRRIKDDAEVRAIEHAIALTAGALNRVLQGLRAGQREHEAEADITRHYRAAGAGHAFDPIVACGRNAALPHYRANSEVIESGQLLLIDTGAVVGGYRSDITRTFPVDGRFDDRQRTVYDAVLSAQRAAIALCRPGARIGEIHAAAYGVIEAAGFGESFIHGTSHHLGLETHDVGDVHQPLEAGCVITVEPGIYLPDERIGVRIEDDVLVTEGEPRILSHAIPSSVDAIEGRLS